MGSVAGFDGDVEFGPFGRLVEEQPVVIDLENVGAELAEPRGDLPKHAGSVRDRETEGDDALLALKLPHHDRGQDARIDVAAAQHEPDVAATKPLRLGEHGGKPG